MTDALPYRARVRLGRLPGLGVLVLGLLAPGRAARPADRPALDRVSVARAALRRGLTTTQVEALHEVRGIDLRTLERMPEGLLHKALEKTRRLKPDHPGEAFLFRLERQKGEDGHVDPEGLPRALDRLEALRAAGPRAGTVAGVPVGRRVLPLVAPRGLLAPATPGRWRWIGPGNMGGRTRALVFDPGEPRRTYVGSAGGGVWRSLDGGESWRPLTDLLASLSVSALVLDPRDARTLYAGTGEGFFRSRGVRGAGIFRSSDGGDTWEHLDATAGPEFGFVNRLAFTADGAVLLAATGRGVRRSLDRGRSFEPPRAPAAREVLDLECHPADPARCVAAGSEGDVLWTADAGASWALAAGIPAPEDFLAYRRVEVTYARADPRVVYASVDQDGGVVYRSRDGGRTFAPRRTMVVGTDPPEPARYLGRQGWYDNAIWAGDPTDPDLVVVGGINLWRSLDGGDAFEVISAWQAAPESAHADHHTIVAHPAYDGRSRREVWFGNDGGVYRAADVRAVEERSGWQERNTNYGVTQFYGAAWNGVTGTVLGGTQDHGTLRYRPTEGPHGWHQTIMGDGGYCAWDFGSEARLFGEYVFLHVQRSEDDGRSADFICGLHWDGHGVTWKDPPYRIDDARAWRANFIAPLVLDPNDPERLFGGGHALWMTEDARAPLTPETGPAWRRVKPGLGLASDRNFVSAVEPVQGRPGEVWAGHDRGQVFLTRDVLADEPRWEVISGRPEHRLPRRWITRIRVDPRDPQRVFVTLGGFHADNVWVSTDGGGSFRPASAGLPPVVVTDLALHPERRGWLYAATAVGVFASEDGGRRWIPTNEGPVNTPVEELLWIRGGVTPGTASPAGAGPWELLAVTHGRGMFAIRPRGDA